MARKPIPYQGSKPFVFVSYAHKDDWQVYPIICAMQKQGLRVWYDDAMDPGEQWGSVIAEHIEDCTAMLCMVTSSFFGSRNCLNEIHYAYEEKKETMILYLEDAKPPREFRLNYGRLHALHRTGYTNLQAFLDKVLNAAKLKPCIGKADSSDCQKVVQEHNAEKLNELGDKHYFGNDNDTTYEVVCPVCDKTVTFGEKILLKGSTVCPGCGEILEFEIEEEEENKENIDFSDGDTAYEVVCPICNETVTFGKEILAKGSTVCPGCGEILEFEIEEEEENIDFGDDDTAYEVVCPICNKTVTFGKEILAKGTIDCPGCGEILEFSLDDEE